MVRTKQTARKSTVGGKAPRKRLACSAVTRKSAPIGTRLEAIESHVWPENDGESVNDRLNGFLATFTTAQATVEDLRKRVVALEKTHDGYCGNFHVAFERIEELKKISSASLHAEGKGRKGQ